MSGAATSTGTGGDPLRLLAQEDVEALPSGDRAVVLSAFRRLQCERQECACIDAEIARQTQEVPGVRLLLSIPGVGRA
jgi:transposase